jgi:Putative zinc-finger
LTIEHPIREEDLELYALGVLTDDERQSMRTHVASCEGCRQRLAVAQGRIAVVAFAAPKKLPPRNVKQRLLERIRADRVPQPGFIQPSASRARSILWIWRWSTAAVLAIALIGLWMVNNRQSTFAATGWISDSICGAKGASADMKDCTISCVKNRGATYVFVYSKTKQVVNIQNQNAIHPDSDIGEEVMIAGAMSDGSLHIANIRPAK